MQIELWRVFTIADTLNNTAKRSNNDRSKRLIKIQLSNDRIRQVEALLRNLTERGAGIELQTKLEKGEQVLISIKNLEPFFGTVAWSEQHRAGLKFDNIIDPLLLTFNKSRQIKDEGLFNGANGYHVFDRFKPMSDFKRPPVKLRQ